MPDQSSAATEHAILQEITGPLEALPDDPLAIIDADFPTSLRGYDRVAVDEYVQQTRQLVAELQATRSPEAAVRRALERVGEQITGILQRAHETVEEITAQSRSEAEDRLEHARREASQISQAAEERVKELDADTDRIWLERQRIVADAEDLAGQLLSLAKVAANRFPSDEDDQSAERSAAEEDASLLAGTPVEAGAPEAGPGAALEADEDPDTEDHLAEAGENPETEDHLAEDTEDHFDDDDAFQPVEPPELRFAGDEDVERTVAFTPLKRSEDETEVTPDDDDEPTGPTQDLADGLPGSDEPRADRGRLTDDDATRVIRPASQAANRRLGR
jgi:cell division septum initiation protein DivIVA